MDLTWTPELEVALFHSLHGHKPVGLNKHFHMICIQSKLQQYCEVSLTTDQIWSHLKKLYDLDSLEEFEKKPVIADGNEFILSEDCIYKDADQKAGSCLSTSPSPVNSPMNKLSSSKQRKRI